MKVHLTEEQEVALRAEIEQLRQDGDGWDLDTPLRLDRGESPAAVLSVRMSLDQMKRLRALAADRQVSILDLVQGAIEELADTPTEQRTTDGQARAAARDQRSGEIRVQRPAAVARR